MKFFPTSPIDQVDPPTPFVHATKWDQFRNQLRSSRSVKSGYRNSLQASDTLNQGALEWDKGSIDCNSTLRSPFVIALQSEPQTLSSNSVQAAAIDECFLDGSLDFLANPDFEQNREGRTAGSSETADYDLELGLLESVQEIAISLAKKSPNRVAIESKTN